MTIPRDLERRLAEHLQGEAPRRAPDWILRSALTTIDTTRQRRGLTALWRNLDMSTYAKLAAAAVVVIAVGALALWRLAPASSGPGGSTVAPSPTPIPTAEATAPPTARPTIAAYVPPPLSETYTSAIHGFSIDYPEGWSTEAATTDWATSGGPFLFSDPASDFMYDPARQAGSLFIGVASQPLDDLTFEQWSTTGVLADEGCGASGEPVVVDGADGVRCGTLALVSIGGRGYAIKLYTGDDPDIVAFDDRAWFNDILATVQLNPDQAVD